MLNANWLLNNLPTRFAGPGEGCWTSVPFGGGLQAAWLPGVLWSAPARCCFRPPARLSEEVHFAVL